MQLEFHQLERRWEHLRVRHPARQRRLLASLADSGQQTPIVVVAAEGLADRYVVIDGYKRIAALEQLGRDTVEAVVWPMSEAAAVLLERSLRLSEHETALEVGWLLAELERRFDYELDELARRFDRSVSWSDLGRQCARTYSVQRVPQSQDHREWLRSCAAVPDAFRIQVGRDDVYVLRVTSALMPMASRISCSRAIATVWYSVSSYRLITCLLTPSLRASSV